MRKPTRTLVFAALAAATAVGPAFADDNSMTAGYGDSWANLQARDPAAATVPALQDQQNAADARAVWNRSMDRMRATGQRMREASSNPLHRMTGTSTTATGTAATTTTGTTVNG